MNPNAAAYIRLIKHPLKFRLFLLGQLPSAFFSGVRVRDISEAHCMATVPYKWFSKNPFRSTYFACLAMAAEMTTGMLGMLYIYKRKPSVSMLVVNVHGDYFKKATGRTTFTCEDGELFNKMIEEAIATGEARTVKAKSVGKNEAGEVVAEFYVTWSFKKRNKG
jgi:hypothetical protein